VHHQDGNVDLGQVGTEVGEPAVDAGVGGIGRGADRRDEGGLPGSLADPGGPKRVDVVKVVEEALEEGVPVSDDCGLGVLEHLPVNAALGVVASLEHERRDHAQHRSPGHQPGAVAAEVMGDFSGTHRKAKQHNVPQC
jgi:hypothetical protein